MALTKINYFIDGKKKIINAKICNTILSKATGLMFRKNSPPLLFIFNKNKIINVNICWWGYWINGF